MKTKYMIATTIALAVALISACSSNETATVTLQQDPHALAKWQYTMQPAGVLEMTACLTQEGKDGELPSTAWQFKSVSPGTVTVSFEYTEDGQNPDAYVDYQYRVADDGQVTLVGVKGNAVPGISA